MNGKPWTTDEIRYLRQKYGKCAVKDMAKVLGRSEKSIRNRAKMDGLAKPKRKLTDEQKQYIIEHHKKMSTSEIVKALKIPKYMAYYFISHLNKQPKTRGKGVTCDTCANAIATKCRFMQASLETAAAALKSIGAKYKITIERDGNQHYRISKCPEYAKGDLPPIGGYTNI